MPKVFDLETKTVTVIPASELCAGFVLKDIPKRGKAYVSMETMLSRPSDKLYHYRFEGELRERVEAIRLALREVDNRSYEEWELAFRRDYDLGASLERIEKIVSVYQKNSYDDMSLAQKKGLLAVLLVASYSTPQEFLFVLPETAYRREHAIYAVANYYGIDIMNFKSLYYVCRI